MAADIETLVDNALNGLRQNLIQQLRDAQATLAHLTTLGPPPPEAPRSPNSCVGVLHAFYFQLDNLGIPDIQVAGWKAKLLSCEEAHAITSAQYEAALSALAAGGRTAR